MTLLTTNVSAYSASASGDRIAVLRSRGITANATELYDLQMLDLVQQSAVTLLAESPRLYQIHTSPDGQWVAYTTQETGGSIYILRAEEGSQPVKVSTCSDEDAMICTGELSWAPDSQNLAWSDGGGIWLSPIPQPGLPAPDPNVVVPTTITVEDPGGQLSPITVTYQDLRWSPFGRYLLAQVSVKTSTVKWLGLVDTLKGRIVEAPGTFGEEKISARLEWRPDGTLLGTFPGKPGPPYLQIWQILPTRENLLGAGPSYTFPDWLLEGKQWQLIGVADTSERFISFALIQQFGEAGKLVQLDLRFGVFEVTGEIPGNTTSVLWAPDGSGVLVQSKDGEVVFLPGGGRQPISLLPVLGLEAHSFSWLAPRPLPASILGTGAEGS